MGEPRLEPRPSPRCPALDRSLGDAEYLSGVGDGIPQHVYQDQRGLLIGHKPSQRCAHVHSGIRRTGRIGQRPPAGRERVERLVVLTARRRPGSPAAHAIQGGVDDDPVQPGRDSGIAAEAGGTPEGRDHRILERVSGLLRIAERADGDRPQAIPVPLEQLTERVRIAVDMSAQQFLVGRGAVVGTGSRRRPVVGRLTWPGQGIAARRLIVRFRRFLPPPWW